MASAGALRVREAHGLAPIAVPSLELRRPSRCSTSASATGSGPGSARSTCKSAVVLAQSPNGPVGECVDRRLEAWVIEPDMQAETNSIRSTLGSPHTCILHQRRALRGQPGPGNTPSSKAGTRPSRRTTTNAVVPRAEIRASSAPCSKTPGSRIPAPSLSWCQLSPATGRLGAHSRKPATAHCRRRNGKRESLRPPAAPHLPRRPSRTQLTFTGGPRARNATGVDKRYGRVEQRRVPREVEHRSSIRRTAVLVPNQSARVSRNACFFSTRPRLSGV